MAVSFQTNKLKSRREAEIDGHKYIVRQYSNIERLEVLRLRDEIDDIVSKYPPNTPDKDISDEDARAIEEKSNQALELLYGLFDDGTEKQEKARKLVSTLDEDDIVEMLTEIFRQTETKEDDKS